MDGNYAQFSHAECARAQYIGNEYQRRQDSIFYNNIDVISTYRRCFKDPVLEQKMFTDSLKVRTYGPWDCDYAKAKGAALCQEAGLLHGNAPLNIFPAQTRRAVTGPISGPISGLMH
jgi:hypothetical protein